MKIIENIMKQLGNQRARRIFAPEECQKCWGSQGHSTQKHPQESSVGLLVRISSDMLHTKAHCFLAMNCLNWKSVRISRRLEKTTKDMADWELQLSASPRSNPPQRICAPTGDGSQLGLCLLLGLFQGLHAIHQVS